MADLTSPEIFQIIFGLVGAMMSVMLFGNLFFLRRLVRKVDLIDSLVVNIGVLAKRLDQLCSKVETVNDLRVELALLKSKILYQSKTPRHSNGEGIEE